MKALVFIFGSCINVIIARGKTIRKKKKKKEEEEEEEKTRNNSVTFYHLSIFKPKTSHDLA